MSDKVKGRDKASLRTIDLFCGGGGLSKGFEQAGFKIIAGVDKKEVFLKTFDRNHPLETMTIKADLMTKDPEEFFQEYALDEEKIDVVIGGPPCKGFSIAGHRDPNDERNNLVDKFINYVEFIKPKMFLMENVPGIISMDDGEVLDIILSRFRNAGYKNATYKILNAADYGVPQKRRRTIFLGRIDGRSPTYPPETHREREQETLTDGDVKPHLTVRKALVEKDFSKLENHEKTTHSEDMVERIKQVEPGESLYEHYGDSWQRLELDRPAPTVKENHNAPFIHPIENRVGTVRECAVLQSFPDDFIFEGPKSQQLKAVGNAVPPLLARRIAEAIKEDLKKFSEQKVKVTAES